MQGVTFMDIVVIGYILIFGYFSGAFHMVWGEIEDVLIRKFRSRDD